MKKIKFLIPAVAMVFGLASCDNMDELYKDEKVDYSIYSTKVEGLGAQSGFKRALLTWTNPDDEIAQTIKISYNEGESVINVNEMVDEYIVNDLAAGTYNFEVRTVDKWGNESLPVTKSVKVYGDQDAEYLARPSITITYDEAKQTHILKFAGVSSAMSMWGGKMEFTLTHDGVTSELNTSLNKEFNQFESKTFSWKDSSGKTLSISGYYSRAIELTVDLGKLAGGTYTVNYTTNAYPANFKTKGNGIICYTAVCLDALDFSETATIEVEAVPEPEPEPEEDEATEASAE